ncbi:MAG TPA: hypothetical protein VNV42_07885 [Solirubrobacteraceae bacterium]|jgi:hypothetical protein|nr:hypothetical protein [Solirubrobacteraceae bacterium]
MPHSVCIKRLIRPRARLLTAAALLSGVLVAGCGGGSPNPSVARLGGATAAGSTAAAAGGAASSGSPSPSALGSDALAFARCMRSNGVPNFPDPQAGGGFLFHASAGLISSPAFKAAQAKCRKLMPGGGPPGPGSTTNPSTQTLARFLKIARCMRGHGISNFPDPRTSVPSSPFGGGAGVISDIEGVILIFPSTIDQQSPEFARAAAACAFPLHNR